MCDIDAVGAADRNPDRVDRDRIVARKIGEEFERVRIREEVLGMDLEPSDGGASSHHLREVRKPKADTGPFSRALSCVTGDGHVPAPRLLRLHAAADDPHWCIRGDGSKGYDGNLMDAADASDEHVSRLMVRAQQGDQDAYVTVLRAITPRIRQIVRRRRAFLGESDVEDVVQEVLLSVHSVRATYDPTRPFMPWLSAIVRHRLADAGRQYARHGAREVGVDDIDVTFPTSAANDPENMFGDPEALARAIDALPPGQRQAVQLLKLRELSLKEASAATGLSVGALKLATHRAMASLRRALRGTDQA